jgi:sterol 3beta-glucosyltransferase
VPAVAATPQPALVPTRQFASSAWPCGIPGGPNRPSYAATRWLTSAWARPAIEDWRRDVLALPPRLGRHDPLLSPAGRPVPVLHAFSAHVVLPPPADWPDTAAVTGYWLRPSAPGWTPPGRLAEFVEGGQPVVYLGFGSMPGPDPGRLVAAADHTGVRAVVASASPALRRLRPAGRFLVIRQAHDWLFPRVQASVHHGGAGTTGAAVTAGRRSSGRSASTSNSGRDGWSSPPWLPPSMGRSVTSGSRPPQLSSAAWSAPRTVSARPSPISIEPS